MSRLRSCRGVVAFVVLVLVFLAEEYPRMVSAESETTNYNMTAMLDRLLSGYDKRVRPNYGGPPVEVGVTIFVLNIGSISEENMDFTVDFYFRQHWRDPRLSFQRRPGIESISMGPMFTPNIWLPDSFIVNEKQSIIHSSATANEFIRIKSNGDVVRSVRISLTASCAMNLHYFPMDRQNCEIEIESYGHNMKDIRYKWNDGPNSIGIANGISLTQFRVVGFRGREAEISLSSGNYSRLACELHFVRYMGYYVMQIYIPAALIVVISWATFWLDRTVAPTRIALGVINVLTMTALMSSTNAYLPRVSYIKPIDLYLGICFFMVFASLIEYAMVCYMIKQMRTKKERYLAIQSLADEVTKEAEAKGGQKQGEVRFQVTKPKITGASNGIADEESGVMITSSGKPGDKLYGVAPSDLDKYSRILFPITFICFNLVYWIIYLHIGETSASDIILLE